MAKKKHHPRQKQWEDKNEITNTSPGVNYLVKKGHSLLCPVSRSQTQCSPPLHSTRLGLQVLACLCQLLAPSQFASGPPAREEAAHSPLSVLLSPQACYRWHVLLGCDTTIPLNKGTALTLQLSSLTSPAPRRGPNCVADLKAELRKRNVLMLQQWPAQ